MLNFMKNLQVNSRYIFLTGDVYERIFCLVNEIYNGNYRVFCCRTNFNIISFNLKIFISG